MNSNLRSLLRFGCLEGTVQGLKYFYIYPDKLSRCFWLSTMVLSCMLAGLLTTCLWGRFRAMPTVIMIEHQNAPIQELPYPAITLCSPNQMTKTNVAHFRKTLVNGNLSIDVETVLPQLLGFYEQVAELDESTLQHFQNLLELNRYNIRDVMTSLSQTCSQFLKHCLFELQITPCEKLFRPLLTAHGLCCVFNSPYHMQDSKVAREVKFHPRFPRRWGVLGGLTVLADSAPHDALEHTLLSAGAIRIMFNDWSEFPSNDESLLVRHGVEAILPLRGTLTYASEEVLQLSIHESISESSRSITNRMCVTEHERRLNLFSGYHNTDCDTECVALAVRRACGCVPQFTPHHPARPLCPPVALPCFMKVRSNMNISEKECNCPRECFSRQYKILISMGNMGAHRHIINKWQYSGAEFTNSSSLLHMAFVKPFYQRNKQETVISFISLISNLGGVFSLCMGCSVISVLELLFYIKVVLHRSLRTQALSTIQRE